MGKLCNLWLGATLFPYQSFLQCKAMTGLLAGKDHEGHRVTKLSKQMKHLWPLPFYPFPGFLAAKCPFIPACLSFLIFPWCLCSNLPWSYWFIETQADTDAQSLTYITDNSCPASLLNPKLPHHTDDLVSPLQCQRTPKVSAFKHRSCFAPWMPATAVLSARPSSSSLMATLFSPRLWECLLFTTDKLCAQLRYSPAEVQIKSTWPGHTVEDCSVIEQNLVIYRETDWTREHGLSQKSPY